MSCLSAAFDLRGNRSNGPAEDVRAVSMLMRTDDRIHRAAPRRPVIAMRPTLRMHDS